MKTFHQGLSLWIAVWTLVWPSSTTTSFFGSFPSGGVAAQTVEWGGCEDPVDGAKKVTIGEKTTVCLTIADGTNWTESRQYIRVNFQPIADEYSRFAIPQSFKEMIVDTGTQVSDLFVEKDIAVHASSQTSLSYQKLYYNATKKYVFPFLTAIIDVDVGKVKGITWDDASLFCGLDKESNTYDYTGKVGNEDSFKQPVKGCYYKADECKENCDLLLYVVWTGTDVYGRSFLSSSYRYSSFPPQEWGDRLVGLLPDVKVPKVDLNPLDGE